MTDPIRLNGLRFILIFLLAGLSGCGHYTPNRTQYIDVSMQAPQDTLYRLPPDSAYEWGDPFVYVNQKGDTVIPSGLYAVGFWDTVTTCLLVVLPGTAYDKVVGVDRRGRRLFDVYWYDNGPDYPRDGLFRIRRYGKIGYADRSGRVVIPARYACADPFYNGRARVALQCVSVPPAERDNTREHTVIYNARWFYIDTNGRRVR